MNELNINNPSPDELFVKVLLTLKDWRYHSFEQICSRIRKVDKKDIKDCIEDLMDFKSKTWGLALVGESVNQAFSSKDIKKMYCITYNGMMYLIKNKLID